MDKIPTKDRILDSALELFSEKGYDGVGVDLIAERAGIKGPSLYKHFKGKEDILDALIEKAENYYQTNFGSVTSPGETPASMEELIALSLKRIEFTLNDHMIRKVRRMLTMEQFRSSRIAALTTKYNIDSVQGIYQQIFRTMMDKGIMRKADPALVSMTFAAPVSLLIQMCDREPQREREAIKRIEEFLRYFAEEYKAEK
ncbi:MAG: TetR/AcrR family transcriptional regulator [Ruminiclostridium sp.]